MTKATIDAEIDANLPTNNVNAITAAIVRGVMHDMNADLPHIELAQGWSLGQTFGTDAYVAINNYAGGASNSKIIAARGSVATPITDNGATAIFQSVGNQTTDSGTTLYASWNKRTTTNNIGGRPIWGEAIDPVGGSGSYVEGARFSGALTGGTNGNGTGLVGFASASVLYKYLVGAETQTYNNSGTDATTTFSSAKFAAAHLASCYGANKSDAGFMTNPF